MLNKLPQLTETLVPDSVEPLKAVDYIDSHIKKYECENLSVDISFMNIIDACYVSTICSAAHYIKYPQGKINWKVSSDKVCELNSVLELGNSEYIL